MLTVGVCLGALTACHSEDGAPAARLEEQSARIVELEVHVPLESTGRRALGIPVPDGFAAVPDEAGMAHFRSTADLRAIVEFYVTILPGHLAVSHDDGVKLAAADHGTDVYVLERGEHRDIYFIPALTAEPTFDMVPAADRWQGGEPVSPFGTEFAWPQGPVAPPGVLDAIRREQGGGGVTALTSGLYEERWEEIDGVRTRVLTPRTGVVEAEPAVVAEQTLELGNSGSARLVRSPAGGYERGNGHRSLRATPELDDEGRPLPFRGGIEQIGDHRNVPH